MKEASFFVWAMNDGEFLFRGICFEEDLFKEFEELKKSEYFSGERWIKILEEQMDKLKAANHPQDTLDEIFRDQVYLDMDFAKGLKLYDTIDGGCFTAKNEIGEAILMLVVMAGLCFIVHRRRFETKENFKIDFEVCHEDYEFDCLDKLIGRQSNNRNC